MVDFVSLDDLNVSAASEIFLVSTSKLYNKKGESKGN